MQNNDLIEAINNLQPHDHLCLIYESKDEQFEAVIPYIHEGLKQGEKCLYIADENTVKNVQIAMNKTGVDVESHQKSGALSIVTSQESYLKEGSFDPDRMIQFLKNLTKEAKNEGYSALRITGEMTWVLAGNPSSDRVMEYEAKLNYFIKKNDCLAICQYNRNKFSPDTILDVIHTHPLVIFGRTVANNFYYIPPDEFLQPGQATLEVDRLLSNIVERERLQKQLLQAQKLKSIGNLGGGIAHDYNNKLAVIQGRTEMAMNKIGKNNPAYNQLKEVHKTTKEAAKLTNKILLFSREQDLFPESLDLNQTIKELRTVLARILDENINLNIDLKQKLPIIKVDKDQIEQVIINLVTNAQEAMPQGGVINISTDSIVLDESQAKTKADISPGKHILMKIEDTGTGIKEEYIDRIFDPFFTTKGMAKSDGMGLPSALGIVKRHNGTIEVDSEVGEGTTFRIYLPVKGEIESAKEEKKYNQYQIHNTGSGESILVVEDNPTVLNYLVDILSENNYNIYEAKDCEQARTIFENNKSNISLLLSDVIMPDGNGIDLAEDFQQDKEELKIILSSGYSNHKAGRSRIKAMGYKYIEKPYGINELLGIIKNTISD
mgnify:CR=1 FL=1